LLINRDDVSLDEHVQQVTVVPDLLQIGIQKVPLRADDQIPVPVFEGSGEWRRALVGREQNFTDDC